MFANSVTDKHMFNTNHRNNEKFEKKKDSRYFRLFEKKRIYY